MSEPFKGCIVEDALLCVKHQAGIGGKKTRGALATLIGVGLALRVQLGIKSRCGVGQQSIIEILIARLLLDLRCMDE
jgi:hypothetical protein